MTRSIPPRLIAAVVASVTVVAIVASVLVALLLTTRNGTADIPVLWYGHQEDGTEVGGVAQATISIRPDDVAGFSMDYQSQAAEGAGSAWQAASASAATVATLLSGRDPAELSIGFAVDGAIDGPSAGGVLTVGILALLNGTEILPRHAMTGTINPDGTIGAIGGLGAKITGARDAGYTSIVAPRQNRLISDPQTGEAVDAITFGASLGIDVALVDDVDEAYSILTGRDRDVTEAEPALRVDGHVQQVGEHAAATLCAETTIGPTTSSTTAAAVAESTSAAAAAIADGDAEKAFGLCADAYSRLQRDDAVAHMADEERQHGIDGARGSLETEIEELLAEAERELRGDAEAIAPDASILLSAPFALTRLTTSTARLQALSEAVDRIETSDQLESAARIIADARSSIEVFTPLSLTLVQAADDELRETDAADLSDFLAGYIEFMTQAGAANWHYAQEVLAIEPQPHDDALVSLIQVTEQLTRSDTSTGSTLADRLVRFSTALSLWTSSAALVVDTQELSLYPLELGSATERTLSDPGPVQTAVDVASDHALSRAGEARADSWNPSVVVWFTTDAQQTAEFFLTRDDAATAARNSLPRLWQGWVIASVMIAYSGRPAPPSVE